MCAAGDLQGEGKIAHKWEVLCCETLQVVCAIGGAAGEKSDGDR